MAPGRRGPGHRHPRGARTGGPDGPPGRGRQGSEAVHGHGRVKPADVNVAELHDAFTILEIAESEEAGFFPRGQGHIRAAEGYTAGRQAADQHLGGLKAKGHPVGRHRRGPGPRDCAATAGRGGQAPGQGRQGGLHLQLRRTSGNNVVCPPVSSGGLIMEMNIYAYTMQALRPGANTPTAPSQGLPR